MANVSNSDKSLDLEIFRARTSGKISNQPVNLSRNTTCGARPLNLPGMLSGNNIYGERNKILCQSEPQLNAWMNRGGVSVMSASDLSTLLAGSGNCASACGGSSCGNDDFDWKDMALMQMMPGLAQVAIAGIAKLFGIDMGGSTQAAQTSGTQQQDGRSIFPANAQNGGASQGGSAVDGGRYTEGPASPTPINPAMPTNTGMPAAADEYKVKTLNAADDNKGTTGTSSTDTTTKTTTTSPLLGNADSAIDTCNKAKTKKEKQEKLAIVKEYVEKFGTQISAKDDEIAAYDETIAKQNKILEEKRKGKAEAARAYNEAKGAYDSQKTTTDEVKGKVDEKEADLSKANGELKSLTNAWNEAKSNIVSAQSAYDSAQSAYDAASKQNPQPDNISELKEEMRKAAEKLAKAKKEEAEAVGAKETKEREIGTLKADLEILKKEYGQQKTELDKREAKMKDAEKTIQGLENDTEYQAAIVARDNAMQGKAAAEAQKREFELKKAEVDGYIVQEELRINGKPDDASAPQSEA